MKDVQIITRVACMTNTASVTRREVRGYNDVEDPEPTTPSLEKRNVGLLDSPMMADAEQHMTDLSIDHLAAAITDSIDPGNPDLRQQVAIYIRQLISAQLAVSLCNSGFELDALCDQSKTSDVRYRLSEGGFNGPQVSNILCFCSVFGLPLNETNDGLEMQLSTSIFALQSSAGTWISVLFVIQSACHSALHYR